MLWQSWLPVFLSLLFAILTVFSRCAASQVFNFTVTEEQPPGQFVGKVHPGSSFSLVNFNSKFNVSSDGVIKTTEKIDREASTHFNLLILYLPGNGLIRANVLVKDINDHTPAFSNNKVSLNILESTPVGHKLSLTPAVDRDFGQNGSLVYGIVSGNVGSSFDIRYVASTNSLDIVVNKTLDRETVNIYSLNLSSCDHGLPKRCGFCIVKVELQDVNDNAPVFNPTRYSGNITENSDIGTSIVRVSATDIDEGSNAEITYSIEANSDPQSLFSFSTRQKGVLVSNAKFDYEHAKEYQIIVKAKDNGGVNSKSSIAHVKIYIVDANDNAPTLKITYFKEGSYQVQEGAAVGTNVALISVSDVDSGKNAECNVGLMRGQQYFSLIKNPSSQKSFLLSVIGTIDREQNSQISIIVNASDNGTPSQRSQKTFYINIGDENDNSPVFQNTPYSTQVNESVSHSQSIFRVTATDKDLGSNSKISYSIINNTVYSSWFRIDKELGNIYTTNLVDREKNSSVSLLVNAADNGTPHKDANISIAFTILDANDNPPAFSQSSYTFSVVENRTSQQFVGSVSATDADTELFLPIRYSTLGTSYFKIDSVTGNITTSHVFDREQQATQVFDVVATDVGGLHSTSTVNVKVIDINDNNPYFPKHSFNISINENTPTGRRIASIVARDDDSGTNADIVYELHSCNPCRMFTIDNRTGDLLLSARLNHMAQSIYRLSVSCRDAKGLPGKNRAYVIVNILPAVKKQPKFESQHYTFTFAENQTVGSFVGHLVAKMDGASVGESLDFQILSQEVASSFSVNYTGGVHSRKVIDFEKDKIFTSIVRVTVFGTNLTAITNMTIYIADVNDNQPLFNVSSLTIQLNEGVPLGYQFTAAKAVDLDAGENAKISYSLKDPSRHLDLDEQTGVLSTKSLIDYEVLKELNVVIIAEDNGSPKRNGTLHLKILIVDINDNPPSFRLSSYFASVSEDAAVGYTFFKFNVTDADSGVNGQFTLMFKKSVHSDMFLLSNDGRVQVAKKLDREVTTDYAFVVIAKDNGYPQHRSRVSLTIIVTDINDNRPVFGVTSLQFSVCEEQPPGTAVQSVTAVDKDEGSNGLVSYKLQPNSQYFEIDPVSGMIKTKIKFDRENSQELYNLIVNATDGGSPSKSSLVEVKISICDVNDNAPEFKEKGPYILSILRSIARNTNILHVQASDKDHGLSSEITYSLYGLNDEAKNLFKVHETTGWVSTNQGLASAANYMYNFSVVAMDKGVPKMANIQTVIVFLLPGRGQSTVFQNYNKTLLLPESTRPNTTVFVARVVSGSGWNFEILEGDSAGYFQIDSKSGEIKLVSLLSYEVTKSFLLKIQAAEDGGTRTDMMYLCIFVIDENREWPIFLSNPMVSGQKENTPPKGFLFQAVATDNDYESNGQLFYSIVSQGPGEPSFDINPFDGTITNTKLLDREKVPQWTLIIKAQDMAVNVSARHSTTATMKLIIFDLNDNAPKFLSRNYTYMMEDERIGYPVQRVVASDEDLGSNAEITYALVKGNERGKFRIQANTGEILLTKKLSFNEQSLYSLTIVASDKGNPSLSSTQILNVEIIDVNNNGPIFSQRNFVGNVTEGRPVGTRVLQVRATDMDAGSNAKIIYRLEANSHFEINSETGWISTKAEIDREQWSLYKLSISADNIVWPFHSDTANVVIDVNDINDCPPVFIDGTSINFTVFENSETVAHRFVASDCDAKPNDNIHYRIIEGDKSKFSVDALSGVLSTAEALDREVKSVYEIKIQASNTAAPYHSVQQTATIFVRDLNDNNPIFTKRLYSTTISENTALNTTVLRIQAHDDDAGSNGQIVYSIIRNKTSVPFEVNPHTGDVYVNGVLDYEQTKKYQFEVNATDMAPYGKRTNATTLVIHISDYNDNAPIFTSPIFEGNSTDSIGVRATDIDSGQNGMVRYKFVPSNSVFSIDSITGKVTFYNPAVGRYKLRVEAYDLGSPQQSSTTTLIVNVGSYSLLMPIFLNRSASVRIPENLGENSYVAKMVARSSSSRITYTIESSAQSSGAKLPFKIDKVTGVVSVNSPAQLDYEKTKSFEVVIRASINDNDTLSTYEKLRVNLTDVNDNAPVIDQRNHVVRFPEALPGDSQVDALVKQFTARDADSGRNGEIETISISAGNEEGVFDMHLGILVLKKNLDYEQKRVYKLELKAKDGGTPPKYTTTRFTVNVVDVNDNPPVFVSFGPQKISEDASSGALICIVEAIDLDESSKKAITYNLRSNGVTERYFYIDPTKGAVKLLRKLDYEERRQFKVGVEASDGKYKSNMTLIIDVVDTNDNAPLFSKPGYDVYLPEIVPVNHVIVRLNATDKDSGIFGQIRYSIPYPPIDAFLINQNTGVITATKRIVLNPRNPPYELLVFALDGGRPPLQSQTRIHLRVKDPNYAGPKFDSKIYPKRKRIFENVPIGALIETVKVTDESNLPGMQVEYSIRGGNEERRFFIDPLYGKIQLAALLDRENISSYSLTIRATDRGTPPQYAETTVTVILVDANDNSPVFEKKEYLVTVLENITQNTVLVRVNATDRDEPDPAIGNGIIGKYAITSGNSLNWFEINSNGVITLIRLLDRESTPVHRLTVTATDKGKPALTGDTSVVIKLEDVNDNRPELSIPNIENLKVLERSEAGKLVFKATAEDRDQGANGKVTYSIIDGDGRNYFTINNETGWVRTKSNNLDYETQRFYVLRIMAVDHGTPPQSSTQEYRIAVQDVNEFRPEFFNKSYRFSIKGSVKSGTKIGTVRASDKDGGSWSKVRFSINTDKLRVGSETGEIFVNADLRKKKEQRRRKRRSTDSETLVFNITADNGPNTLAESVPMEIEVDYSCPGCIVYVVKNKAADGALQGVPLILVIVFTTIFALLLLCFVVFLWRQRHRPDTDAGKVTETKAAADTNVPSDIPFEAPETELRQPDDFDSFHPSIFKQPSLCASSGHGSSGSQLLGESRRASFTATDNGSTHSFFCHHKPVLDSGIVGDIDRLSDVTISDIAPSSEIHYMNAAEVASSVGSSFGRRNEVNSSLSRKLRPGLEYSTQSDSHDSLNDFKDEGGGEAAGRIEFGNLLYTKLAEVDADENEAVMDGTRPFMEEGAPSRGGSLSTIIGSDEEMRGSYNWDYLVDWGPQFKPVASVFSEIARVNRGESGEKTMSLPNRASLLNHQPLAGRVNPARTLGNKPMEMQVIRTAAMHDRGTGETPAALPPQNIPHKTGLRHSESINSKPDSIKPNYGREANQSNFISNRTSMLSSFASLPRSPLSAQSSYTSGPLSPNFTPAITPLITRSPSVSPLETPSIASPMDSKPESVLDIAERSHKSRSSRGSRRSDKITLSDRSSEQEIAV
eukprot:gene945-10708_t